MAEKEEAKALKQKQRAAQPTGVEKSLRALQDQLRGLEGDKKEQERVDKKVAAELAAKKKKKKAKRALLKKLKKKLLLKSGDNSKGGTKRKRSVASSDSDSSSTSSSELEPSSDSDSSSESDGEEERLRREKEEKKKQKEKKKKEKEKKKKKKKKKAKIYEEPRRSEAEILAEERARVAAAKDADDLRQFREGARRRSATKASFAASAYFSGGDFGSPIRGGGQTQRGRASSPRHARRNKARSATPSRRRRSSSSRHAHGEWSDASSCYDELD